MNFSILLTASRPYGVLLTATLCLLSFTFVSSSDIVGTIDKKPNVYGNAYNATFQSFTMSAYDENGDFLKVASLDQTGNITLRDFQDILKASKIILKWAIEQPIVNEINEQSFVLWPLETTPLTDFCSDCFRLIRMSDVHVLKKREIVEKVSGGDFQKANELLEQLRRLYRFFEDNGELNPTIETFEFKLFQETCGKARDYLKELGRSKVTDEMISLERSWRRKMINSLQRGRLLLALNSWAGFSREVYSYKQRHWPTKTLGSIDSTSFYGHNSSYSEWMFEDTQLVLDKLDENSAYIEDLINVIGLDKIPKKGPRDAVGNIKAIIDMNVENVTLDSLMNLLNGLNLLRALDSRAHGVVN